MAITAKKTKKDDPNDRISEARRSPAEARRGDPDGLYKDYREVHANVFVGECYAGSGGFSGKTKAGDYTYIIPNATENFFNKRIQMSVYTNYFKKFVDAKYKPIFKQNINTYVKKEDGSTIEDHLYYDFVANVTGNGASKKEFEKIAIRSAIKHDLVFVVMDKKASDWMPFLYLKQVKDLLDYTVDAMGNLTSVTFYDGARLMPGGKKRMYKRYISLDKWSRLYSDDEGKTWSKDKPDVENVLQALPIYPMFYQRPDDLTDYDPHPSNFDIASFSAWLYDKSSKLDYLIDKQAHSRLVLQGRIADIASGVDNCINIQESEKPLMPPQYLSPDAGMPAVHSQRISDVLEQMFDIMSESGVSVAPANGGAGSVESGIAKSYTFNATNTCLKSTVSVLVDFSEWLYRMYKRFTSDVSPWIATTEYPEDFTPTTKLAAKDLIEIIQFYKDAGMPENVIDLHLRLRNVIDPHASREESSTLYQEIEEAIRTEQGSEENDESSRAS